MAEIPGDTYDPCGAFIELRDARLAVLKGETPRSVRFKNGDEERETVFAPSNLEALDKAMSQARRECLALQDSTGRPARSAIGVGFRGPAIRGPY